MVDIRLVPRGAFWHCRQAVLRALCGGLTRVTSWHLRRDTQLFRQILALLSQRMVVAHHHATEFLDVGARSLFRGELSTSAVRCIRAVEHGYDVGVIEWRRTRRSCRNGRPCR